MASKTNDSVMVANFSARININLSITGNMSESIRQDPLISLKVPAMMFASGVFGNVLAIIVLLRSSREHKQSVFYRLVGALACTDLFGTCATSPVTLAVYANNLKWVGGDLTCHYGSFMLIFAGYSTVFTVGTMAVDRFLAIMCPFFYDTHITKRRTTFGIVGLWIFAAVLGFLPILGLGQNVNQYPGTWCFFNFTSSDIKNQIFAYSYASIGLVVIFVTAIFNLLVTYTLLQMRRKMLRSMNVSNTKRNDSELQMMVLLMGIIIIFSTCWCPFLIRILINQTHFRQVDKRADLQTLRLASFNQILDPWVYILFRKELFNRSFTFLKTLVKSVCRCNPLTDDVTDDVEHASVSRRSTRVVKSENSYSQLHETAYVREQYEPDTTHEDHLTALCNSDIENCASAVQSYKESSSADEPVTVTSTCSPKVTLGKSSVRGSSCKTVLHLKHSACLFCLSNHPKEITLMCKQDRKSMSNIPGEVERTACPDLNGRCLYMLTDARALMRKNSFHTSLDDVGVPLVEQKLV
ncbi:prostaglandin E2 receptor EP3 subtype-like [Dreissena polymorpha]|uniref:Thromboxane A2 receptor n=1 Tax=Dreissena polymorpha TaxID=45954 RepID=A0A9D4RGA0_DREPO|nr:prostaglandin E2 receptor EP3 subtype-like [Dreissena polymorpha]KAH3867436.1 hypothetical protein DPMN_030563 [Dreissena polymorpha]